MSDETQAPDPARAVIEQCRDALAEELAAWDIDPPLHHVKTAHDACVAWLALAAIPAPEGAQADERKAFETWAKSVGFHRDELDRSTISIVSPAYYNAGTERQWQAWQARAALAAPAPQALTDELLKEHAEHWHDHGEGPGSEVSRRKAALLAFKAGARFAESRHGIPAPQTKEPTNDR